MLRGAASTTSLFTRPIGRKRRRAHVGSVGGRGAVPARWVRGCLLPHKRTEHKAPRATGPDDSKGGASGGASTGGPAMQELATPPAGVPPPYVPGDSLPKKPQYVTRPVPQPKTVGFFDAMKFSGPAPEIINGRLAMVGFMATAVNELQQQGTIEEQVLANPLPIAIFVLLTVYATLVPIMKGVRNEAFGVMSPRAETTNGRAAMLAFVVMLVLEHRTGIPFF